MATGEVPNWARKFMSAEDLGRVRDAVARAEKGHRGEIVPVIVPSSTPLQGVLLTVTFFLIALFGFVAILEFPQFEPWSFLASVILAIVVGYALSRVGFVQRLALPEADEQKAVFERAQLEFYRCGVHQTRDRVGVLIFLSLLEHKVVVLADEGLAKDLPAQTWEGVVGPLVASLKRGDVAAGLTQAIESCGKLLQERFPGEVTKSNELRNDLIFRS